MLTPDTTHLSATAITSVEIDTVTTFSFTATVRRNELTVHDLQKVLKEIPLQYNIQSITTEPDKAGGEPVIVVRILCTESRTIKSNPDNSVPTPRCNSVGNTIPHVDHAGHIPVV